MYTVIVVDMEEAWTENDVKSTMGSFDTKEQAENFAQHWFDHMERVLPDFTQVYSYEVVPIRTPEMNEAYYLSLVGIYNRAEYREGPYPEMDEWK